MRNFEQYGSGAIVFSHQKIRLENDKKKLEKEYLILELQILKEELRDSYAQRDEMTICGKTDSIYIIFEIKI